MYCDKIPKNKRIIENPSNRNPTSRPYPAKGTPLVIQMNENVTTSKMAPKLERNPKIAIKFSK
jgi:hypothetical protein